MSLYSWTDETPEERRRILAGPLIEEDDQQVRIVVGKVNGDTCSTDDCVVTMLKHSQQVSIEKGHFGDDRFIFENKQEINDVVAALNRMLVIIRNQSNTA